MSRRLFQTIANFSLFKFPSFWHLLPYRNIFRLFDFVGGSETGNRGVQTFPLQPSIQLTEGWVYSHFKDHLSLALRPDLTTLDECLVCEIQNGSKRFFLRVLYLSPSQSIEQFSLLRQRWEQTIINTNDFSPTIAIYIVVFNARNSEWWNGDSTNQQCTELAELAAKYNLNQIIDSPTHILPNSASCIELIFTIETNLLHSREFFPRFFWDVIPNQFCQKWVSLPFFLLPTGEEFGISQVLILSGKLLIALIGIGSSTA